MISVQAEAQQPAGCKRFKDGKFYSKFEGNTDIIVRSGSEQSEYFNGSKQATHYTVKWLDDCTYTLTPQADVFVDSPNLPKNIVFIVKIISTGKDSYLQETTNNVNNYKLKSEMYVTD